MADGAAIGLPYHCVFDLRFTVTTEETLTIDNVIIPPLNCNYRALHESIGTKRSILRRLIIWRMIIHRPATALKFDGTLLFMHWDPPTDDDLLKIWNDLVAMMIPRTPVGIAPVTPDGIAPATPPAKRRRASHSSSN